MTSMPRHSVLVTGSTGFVGRALCSALLARGHDVTAACRDIHQVPRACRAVGVGDIGPGTDWSDHLSGIDTVIHLASRAHVLAETASDPIASFRRVNVGGTLQLARAAREAGVRRLVFVSSIGVHGNAATEPIRENTPAAPAEAYAISKWEAELELRALLAQGLPELVIVRPPLVYGPDCPGNFRRLLGLVARGLPLPLGAFDNRRSLIGVDNLADVLALCVEHPGAAGETFVVADEPAISTPALMVTLAKGIGVKDRLWRAPPGLVRAAARLCGVGGTLDKLCGDLQVDSSRVRDRLGWVQPLPLREGLLAAGRWYAEEKH